MIQNIPKEKILEVLKEGPTIPAKIAKRVGGDTMLIGAILSTLISTGEVKYTTLKIGGSPVYYINGQENRLEEFTNYLGEKDRKTQQILKDKKILLDNEQEPMIRVSLRAIKDFAKQFETDIGTKKEICWRYYTLDKEDAITLLLAQHKEKEAREIASKKQAAIEEQEILKRQEQKETLANINISKDLEITNETNSTKKPVHTSTHTITHTTTINELSPQDTLILSTAAEKTTKIVHPIKSSEDSSEDVSDSKQDFFETIKKHIHEKGLDIISKEKIKKTEYDLVVKDHDKNEYIYCKAKDKKSINEGDLASAFVYAQNKRMPCMFLTTGNLSKKAESMVHKEFKDMVIDKM